jgi:hypothetical protein
MAPAGQGLGRLPIDAVEWQQLWPSMGEQGGVNCFSVLTKLQKLSISKAQYGKG